ncbi:TlpA disulfide reductase family protein [Anaerobacillus sp. MEB173]|uniref:TlpA disulfide reductase family protein n=1 Tax=Anaerobacillus sp. MEB173 TaxID=3383345 RepID=UPI003F9296E1
MKGRFTTIFILGIAAVAIIYVLISSNSNKQVSEQNQFLTEGEQSDQTAENEQDVNTEEIINEDGEIKTGIFEGMIAEDFTLPLWETEEKKALSDYRGEIVILNMWASWCPPCRKEMPDLIQLHDDYKEQGVAVVGINMASVERNAYDAKEFMEEFQVNFPTLVDVDGEVADIYQVLGIPVTYVLNEDGVIYKRIMGAVTYDMLAEFISEIKKQ